MASLLVGVDLQNKARQYPSTPDPSRGYIYKAWIKSRYGPYYVTEDFNRILVADFDALFSSVSVSLASTLNGGRASPHLKWPNLTR